MKKIRSLLISGLLLFSMFSMLLSQVKAQETIRVPQDYPTIQAAISAANQGDTVLVSSGTYVENVGVSKPLSVIGQNNPLIQGRIGITASNVVVSGFNITGGLVGIHASGYSNVTISNNNIYNVEVGVSLPSSSSNRILNNNISGAGWSGIYLYRSTRNAVLNNTIKNSGYGVWIIHYAHDNILYGNILLENQIGILIDGWVTGYWSGNNQIDHNDFINNTRYQAYHEAGSRWDNGSEGNYWSDYTGSDADNNGIGDTPYDLPAGGNRDSYPLMRPFRFREKPPPLEADFEISVSPEFQTVNPGGPSVSYTISLTPLGESSSEVFLESEWVGTPPADTVGQLSATRLTPPDTATLTVTTSPSTPLGQYTIEITGTSGSISHSKTVTLIVSRVVEIEINEFYVKKDFDLLWPGAADVYFQIGVNGFDDDYDPLTDLDTDYCRIPIVDNEIHVNSNEKMAGPAYVPYDGFQSMKFPVSFTTKVMDNDGALGSDEIFALDFVFSSLGTTVIDNQNIYLQVTVRNIEPRPLKVRGDLTNDKTIIEKTNPPTILQYGLADQWYWFEVAADRVWEEYGATSLDPVTVAVLDSGIDFNHPDLKNKIWYNANEIPNNGIDDDNNGYIDDYNGFDFVNGESWTNVDHWGKWKNDADGPLDDSGGHGTGVSGIIAAEINNAYGIAGIAPNANIMAIKVTPYRELKGLEFTTSVIEGIDYAVKMGAKIISMSLGSYDLGLFYDKTGSAVGNAYKKGVTLIAAAGNERTANPSWPASFTEVISVSALQRKLGNSGYDPFLHFLSEPGTGYSSNFGPDVSYSGRSVELSAPGYNLETTSPSWLDIPFTKGFGQTSGSTPIVSAVAAIVLGYAQKNYPARPLNPNEVRYIMRMSSDDLGPLGWDPYYGYGMVNAYRALQEVDELLGRRGWQIKLDPPGNLDLHAFDALGRHVGINYETGDLEMQIPEAIHTGDETNGSETIYLPSEITDYEIRIVNRETATSVEFTLNITSFDSLGNLIMEEPLEGLLQADSEMKYVVDGVETGEFNQYEFDADADNDGLSNGAEILRWRTDPLNSDTDGDGFSDGFEVQQNTDPLDPTSHPLIPPSNIWSSDSLGNTKDVFVPGETVYVTVAGVGGQTVTLYVVADQTTWNTGDPLIDVSGGADTLTLNSGGGTQIIPIWTPPLIVGSFDIVLDTNDNGVFDAGLDLVDSIIVPGFYVVPEVPFGTAMTFLSMLTALVGFIGFKRFRPKTRLQ
ncbi:MAG TPA: S8 family serine peptidase [Candidatus Bathyarchaeia archaeon]|nr:S8 family serine peptidase [Candidatus Bathyarchaeia archaeon]